MGKLETLSIPGFRCLRCQHTWIPRKYDESGIVRVCPKCKSHYWDRPSVPTPQRPRNGE